MAAFGGVAAVMLKSVDEPEVDVTLEEVEFVKLKEATLVAARRRANNNILPPSLKGSSRKSRLRKSCPQLTHQKMTWP